MQVTFVIRTPRRSADSVTWFHRLTWQIQGLKGADNVQVGYVESLFLLCSKLVATPYLPYAKGIHSSTICLGCDRAISHRNDS